MDFDNNALDNSEIDNRVDNGPFYENIVEEAFKLLFPEKPFDYDAVIKYSGHFKDYGAAISLRSSFLQVKLSRRWEGVSKEIQIGLIQELLLRLFRKKYKITKKHQINSFYIDLYNSFVKNLHKTIAKDKISPLLKQSFDRVNERYFYNMVELPNLVLANYSTTKFGTYDYKTDTVSITESITNDQELLDYVMYHEMLHKKHSFKANLGSNRYHTSDFKKAEKEFENSREMERRLSLVASKNVIKKRLGFQSRTKEKKPKGLLSFIKELFE